MKWKINIEEIEDAIFELKDSIELLDEFKSKYVNLIELIQEQNKGEFIDSISIATGEEIELIDSVVEKGTEIIEGAENYLEKIEEINPWTGHGIYELDIDTVKEALKDVRDVIEEEVAGVSHKTENKMEDMESQIREFNNVDESMNEEKEYKDEEDIIKHIKDKRYEIEDEIVAYRNNEGILEEAEDVVKRLEQTLDELI